MSRPVTLALAANLLVLAILAVVYPHLMVSPGKLIPGHHELETDCFACHAPFGGAAAARCASCHKVEEIGRLTVGGHPLVKPLTATPFHQKLLRQDCLACHSDHSGVRRFRAEGRFDHALLRADSRAQCQTCHGSPKDRLHQRISANCGQCHTEQRWTPAKFDHAALQADSRKQCQACHAPPRDGLHQRVSGNCSHCHTEAKWTPASFDHDKYFRLDRDHDVKCATCHAGDDYGRYTCYGCHEHTPENIRRSHVEEGIRDFKNCVACHRSADEHDIRMPGRERITGKRNGDD